MPNGLTFCQLKEVPTWTPFTVGQLGVGSQMPGPVVVGTKNVRGDEPSPVRRRIIAAAAASPVAMPSSLAWPSGMTAREAARAASRAAALAGKYVLSTRCAAAIAAASGDAPSGASIVPR